ncbi:MAG: hypothetical protein FWB91_02125 [Defluviitaleaceae bacterium]|nr:hypothetical protein [Defluviitaleaceae bacterium]
MNIAKMKNWSIALSGDNFTAPELRRKVLQGNIYDDQAGRFPDGSAVTTSPIVDIVHHTHFKSIFTRSTRYDMYPHDIDPEYEKAFPGAYKRLGVDDV